MRIAYIVNQFPPAVTAGLGRYVELITPDLARDHELVVFTLNDGRQPVDERVDGVSVNRPRGIGRGRRLNRTRRWEFLLLALNVVVSNWRYFLRLRRQERPDLVSVHDSTNFLSGLLCHYVLRLPVVFHVHTTEYGVAPQRSIRDPLNLFAALERWLARVSQRVVVATPEVRDQLVAAGWTGRRSTSSHWAARTSRWSPASTGTHCAPGRRRCGAGWGWRSRTGCCCSWAGSSGRRASTSCSKP